MRVGRAGRRASPAPGAGEQAAGDVACGQSGVRAIATVTPRARVRVAGRVTTLRIRPWGDAPSLEAVLSDGTGRIDAVFLGRRWLPGLRLGSEVVVEGRAGLHRGRLALLNPDYHLSEPPPTTGERGCRPA